jgi:CDGSH-type Zn-finger protein
MTPDSSAGEKQPSENVIQISANGPLYFCGRVEIDGNDTRAAFSDTRVALCRCGASQSKPLCDKAHTKISFSEAGLAGPSADGVGDAGTGADGDVMRISPRMNGPLHVQGKLRIENANGEVIFRGNDAWLCRCGASKEKPFCDGSHKAIGFRSGEGEGFPASRART